MSMHHDDCYPDNYDPYCDDEYVDDAPGLTDALGDQLQRTPWWALSLSMHLFVLLVILPMVQCERPPVPAAISVDTRFEETEELLEEDPTEQVQTKVQADLPPTPDAVDTPTPDIRNESETDDPDDRPQGDPDHVADAQMDSRFTNAAIGPGPSSGGKFGYRDGGGRMERAKGGGGGADTEHAVELGLKWLADHQDRDGKWDGDGFMKHDPADDVTTGAAREAWGDPGLTGLATLAFLGAGHTHRYGRYKDTVKRAVRYLMRVQSADGLVGGTRGHYLYNHAIATLALAEAYGMTRSPLVRSAAARSVEYLVSARNPGLAWRYGHTDGDSDV